MLLKLIPLAVFLGIAGFLWKGLSLDPGALPSPLIDQPAPSFSAATLDADLPSFDSDGMLGKVWVLNVWASWCGPCAQEHPQLVALSNVRDVPIVGLNYKDVPDDARRWLDHYGNIFSDVLTDENGDVGLDWGVYGVPETFLIDAEGRVRMKHVGPILPADLEEKLLPAIDSLVSS